MTTTPNKMNKKLKKYDNILSLTSLSKEPIRKYMQYAYHKLIIKYYSIQTTFPAN